MREYGVRSAILTMLRLTRNRLMTKEEVKQKYRDAHEDELEWERGAIVRRSLTDDLESFYNCLQNPESKPKAEAVPFCFLTQKLNEEELRLLNGKK